MKVRNQYSTIFIDEVTVSSLIYLVCTGRSAAVIWSFEPVSANMRRLLVLLDRLKLINADICQVDSHVGQIHNKSGENEYVEILHQAQNICNVIKREQLDNNPLIPFMNPKWSTPKVKLYFLRFIETNIREECLRINLADWMLRTQIHGDQESCVLVTARGHWHAYLNEYSQAKGIQRLTYYRLFAIAKISKLGLSGYRTFKIGILKIVRKVWEGDSKKKNVPNIDNVENQDNESERSNSALGICYGHQDLSFDPTKRSEFFWLKEGNIPNSEVILFDVYSHNHIKNLDQLQTRGIRLFGHAPGIPKWIPTLRLVSILAQVLRKLAVSVMFCLFRGHRFSLYVLLKLGELSFSYAKWYDFFNANRIRIVVLPWFFSAVGQTLALDVLGGVSVSFQYSSLLLPSFQQSAGENLQFVFSEGEEERLLKRMGIPADQVIPVGYVYDNASRLLRDSQRVTDTRKQLMQNGARFILCFFDENSRDCWYIPASNKAAALDYKFLLRWLLADPTLGIVFKPKEPFSLFKRIGYISDLVDRARKTGRCVFLGPNNNSSRRSVYPTEAALIADVSIGKLLGATAALEARLAGKPTVLIDNEGWHSHTFYSWGHDHVVFDNWELLRTAIERYRSSPSEYSDFGNWATFLNHLDPFQDGKASLRIGLYIRWVYEALRQGKPKQEALAIASNNFVQRWGKEY